MTDGATHDEHKTALLIAPNHGDGRVIGARRGMMWSKYLRQFGWRLCVLAVEHRAGWPSEDTDEWGSPVRRLGIHSGGSTLGDANKRLKVMDAIPPLRWARQAAVALAQHWLVLPDNLKFRLNDYVAKGREMVDEFSPSAIISTVPQFGIHPIAAELARQTKLPWVADYRDLWSSGYFAREDPIRRWRETRMERAAIAGAAKITTATEAFTHTMQRRFGADAVTLYNGFDPDAYQGEVTLDSQFTLTYVGTIYRREQAPYVLTEALRQMCRADYQFADDLMLHYAGRSGPHFEHAAKDLPVTNHGLVSRDRAVRMTRSAQGLILSYQADGAQRGMLVAKLFDYLAARRPIISNHSDGDNVERILGDTKAGEIIRTVEGAKSLVARMYDQWQATGRVQYHADPNAIEEYSVVHNVRKMAEVLNEVTV